jgi:hypothetical protein
VTAQDLAVAHQLDARRIAHADRMQVRFLKNRQLNLVCIDDRNGVRTGIDEVA